MRNEKDVAFTPGAPLQGSLAEGQVTDTGSPSASGSKVGGGETLHERVDEAKELAGTLRHRAVEEVESRVSEQRMRAADSLEQVAKSLRSAGDQEHGVGRYIAQAADQVDHFAGFLKEHDFSDLVDNVEDLARRQPAAFLGGAFALGLVGARFLKSSRHEQGYPGSRGGRPSGFAPPPVNRGAHAADLATPPSSTRRHVPIEEGEQHPNREEFR